MAKMPIREENARGIASNNKLLEKALQIEMKCQLHITGGYQSHNWEQRRAKISS